MLRCRSPLSCRIQRSALAHVADRGMRGTHIKTWSCRKQAAGRVCHMAVSNVQTPAQGFEQRAGDAAAQSAAENA